MDILPEIPETQDVEEEKESEQELMSEDDYSLTSPIKNKGGRPKNALYECRWCKGKSDNQKWIRYHRKICKKVFKRTVYPFKGKGRCMVPNCWSTEYQYERDL